MSLAPFAYTWGVLIAIVVGIAIYRQTVASHEDETVHVAAGAAKVEQEQAAIGKKIDHIDFWGKLLTVIVAVFGLILLTIYLYRIWQLATTIQ